jgi:LysM domain-containing protein
VSGSSGRADEPRGRLSLSHIANAAAERGWKAFAAPAAFLLAATIAVMVVRSIRHPPSPRPAPSHLNQLTTHVPPAPRSYTVRAGDTFAAIAAKTGVPLARIRVLNPRLAPTALFIGEKIRVR